MLTSDCSILTGRFTMVTHVLIKFGRVPIRIVGEIAL